MIKIYSPIQRSGAHGELPAWFVRVVLAGACHWNGVAAWSHGVGGIVMSVLAWNDSKGTCKWGSGGGVVARGAPSAERLSAVWRWHGPEESGPHREQHAARPPAPRPPPPLPGRRRHHRHRRPRPRPRPRAAAAAASATAHHHCFNCIPRPFRTPLWSANTLTGMGQCSQIAHWKATCASALTD